MYQNLYNSCNNSEGVKAIKEELQNLIAQDPAGQLCEADKITADVLKEAANRMKPGKSDISGSYTSDAILNAPKMFFSHMALVFRSWLRSPKKCSTFLGTVFSLNNPSSLIQLFLPKTNVFLNGCYASRQTYDRRKTT